MIIFLLVIVILIVLNIHAYLDMVKSRERYYALLNISEFEKSRIANMSLDTDLCLCPKCNSIVTPRFSPHRFGAKSGLYWCPKCFKGEAGCFWISFGRLRDLSGKKIKELKKKYENSSK